MKIYCSFTALLLMLAIAGHAQPTYTLEQLQGAWWSDSNSPTADFAITDDQVWLDFDSDYHPCSITGGNVLVFDLGEGNGDVEHRIISLDDATLVLENLLTRETTRYMRNQ